MELMYSSTRNDKVKLTASQAILKGLADDGGLFVPERIPALDVPMDTLADMSYQETAYEVMSRFFTDFTAEFDDELVYFSGRSITNAEKIWVFKDSNRLKRTPKSKRK